MKKIIHSIQLQTKMFLLMGAICCLIPASLSAYCNSTAIESEDTRITNVTLNTLNVSSPSTCAVYTDYTSHSTDLIAGETYTISVTHGTCFDLFVAYITVYIDFYQNGEFTQADEVFRGLSFELGPVSGTITVPSDAVPGSTRMRVIISEDDHEPPCGSYDYGETQDFSVSIINTPCIDPPVPGSATSSHSDVCSEATFVLSLSGHSTGIGQTYQWQSSADSIEWDNIDNATEASLNATQEEETWYRALVTCGAEEISEAVKVSMLPSVECYCISTAISNEDTRITNVTLNTLNVSSPSTCAVYTDYTNHSTDLKAGETYTISVTHGTCLDLYPAYITVYIDFYRNGEFTQADEVFLSGSFELGPVSGIITVPSDAVPGSTRMRVIISEDDFEPPCGSYDYGETQDFSVNIINTPCTDPPVPGSATSSHSDVCSEEVFLLSLSGHSTGAGQTYQWQSSVDSIEWDNIDNATEASLNATQEEETWYRAIVMCGAEEISEAVKVGMLPSLECYCISTATSNEDTRITNVTLNTLDVSSPNTCAVYTDYTNHSTDLIAGDTYTISVTHGTCSGLFPAYITVYIDFYRNGEFTQADEVFRYGPSFDLGPVSGIITVPSDAVPGSTRMRVILSEDDFEPPCGSYDYGETQDFSVNIINTPCTDPPIAGSATSSHSDVCSEETFLLSLSGHSTGSGQTYQWQSSADGMEWDNIDNATDASLNATQEEETWYRAIVTCGAAEISEAVKVSMLPSIECYCSSTAFDDGDSRITNVLLHTLDVSSPSSCAVYTDYSNHSTDLEAGETYTISVTHGTCIEFYSAWITVYIDFYQTGEFTEADEVFRYGPTGQLGPVSGTISVPSDAVSGPTRMRVILSEAGHEPPCGIYEYGETQDFTVNIERSTNITTLQESAYNFTIFPNHASDKCSISLRSPNTSDFHLAVYDIMGRVVYSHSGISERELLHEIDISAWPVGQYIVNMNIDGKQLSRKLIVSR